VVALASIGGDLHAVLFALRDKPTRRLLDIFVRREDAERFVEAVRGDEPELTSYPRIERSELEAGGLN
jgi:hypothetical protein